VLLLAQLAPGCRLYLGYALLFWPFVPNITDALITAGPGLWGSAASARRGDRRRPRIIQDLSALSGIITITLQISYLPTLYGAFSRRENEISLLTARAGSPSWGPELGQTRYALAPACRPSTRCPSCTSGGRHGRPTWPRATPRTCRWSGSARPPRSSCGGVVAGGARLGGALPVPVPGAAPEVQARLCLRSGLICLGEVARAMGLNAPTADAPDMAGGLMPTHEDFLEAVERLREVDFPIERDPEEAWQDFSGWRVNYEKAAYELARAVSAVRAPWSGPRLHPDPVIYPLRPAPGRPPEKRHRS
jgi:hypothetical protein